MAGAIGIGKANVGSGNDFSHLAACHDERKRGAGSGGKTVFLNQRRKDAMEIDTHLRVTSLGALRLAFKKEIQLWLNNRHLLIVDDRGGKTTREGALRAASLEDRYDVYLAKRQGFGREPAGEGDISSVC